MKSAGRALLCLLATAGACTLAARSEGAEHSPGHKGVSARPKEPGSKRAGNQAKKPIETVFFEEGRSSLSEREKAKIRNAVKIAQARGPIETVHVAAWSDKPASTDAEQLTDQDTALARDRVLEIEQFLRHDLRVADIHSHNLGAAGGWLARAVTGDEAELDSIFLQANAPMIPRQDIVAIRQRGGPQKAVVWIDSAPRRP